MIDKWNPETYNRQIRMPLKSVDWINETGGTIMITGRFENGKKADIRIHHSSASYQKIKNRLQGKKKGSAIVGTKHGNLKIDSYNYNTSSLKGTWFSSSKVHAHPSGEYSIKDPRILD